MKFSGSILSSKTIEEGIKKFQETDIDYLHLDIMDGTMSQNIQNPYQEIKKGLIENKKALDIHIMSSKPKGLLKKYLKFNPGIITLQTEIENIKELITLIKKKCPSAKIGLSLTTSTKIDALYSYIDLIDHILIMGVELGVGGSGMCEGTIKKVIDVKEYLKENNITKTIAVDGGINDKNIKNLSTAAIDIAVMGKYITGASSYQGAINKLKESIK